MDQNDCKAMDQTDWSPTWRIIPGLGSAVNSFRPLTGVVGTLSNGPFMAYTWGLRRDNQCSMANQSTPP